MILKTLYEVNKHREEKRDGAAPAQVGGVPGAVSNIGPVPDLNSTSGSGEKYEKTTGTTNFEISKTVSTTKMEFARIKRITAAVVVDGKYEAKKADNGDVSDEMAVCCTWIKHSLMLLPL